MTREEKLQLAGFHWDKKPELRAEFSGDREAYLAFVEAELDGSVKTFTGKVTRYTVNEDGEVEEVPVDEDSEKMNFLNPFIGKEVV